MATLSLCPAASASCLGTRELGACASSLSSSNGNGIVGNRIYLSPKYNSRGSRIAKASERRRHNSWVLDRKQGARSSYSGTGTEFSSAPIDVVADVKNEKIVILGGSGFVGSAIAEEATKRDVDVVSFSRSGRPKIGEPWLDKVVWIAGDVFSTDWDSVLLGATAVVSTLGGFGSQEAQLKLNGDANVLAVNAASQAGIKKFIYISVHDYRLPDFALQAGYFTGKRRAEKEIQAKYPDTGTILRPGFIYGNRRVNGFEVPLGLIGKPLEAVLARTETFTRPLANLPGADILFAPPVSVKDVALAALNAVKDDTISGILDIQQIKDAAVSFASV